MNLLAIKAKNWLGLEAVEIQPHGPVTEISGANGAGKSATLSAFVCALTGKESIPADPVRHGAKESEIEVDFDELRIRLVVQPDRSTRLVVTNAEGFTASKPQQMLNGLYSKLIDPVEFSRMKPAEQRALVAELVGLSAMLDELARADQQDKDARRDVNRDLKAATARLAAMPEVAAVEPVDVSATLAEIRAAREHNAAVVREHQRRDGELHAAADYRTKAQGYRDEAQRLLDQAAAFEARASEMEEVIASMANVPDAIELDELEQRLEQAESINAQHRAHLEREREKGVVQQLEAASQTITDRMAARDAERAAVIQAAAFPIPGIGLTEDGVTLNGFPLEQASSAEQLRLSAAIGMALNPKLRVMVIRDGSLLDEDSLKLLTEAAEAEDFVLLVETVDTTGQVGIYIEDGNVRAVNGKAVAA